MQYLAGVYLLSRTQEMLAEENGELLSLMTRKLKSYFIAIA